MRKAISLGERRRSALVVALPTVFVTIALVVLFYVQEVDYFVYVYRSQ